VLELAYSFRKEPSLSNRQIAINSTYALTSYALRRDLGFNLLIIFGTETGD
jgi:hypothetical protein